MLKSQRETFFLVVTPGLEEFAHEELTAKWRLLEGIEPFDSSITPSLLKGGIEFEAKPAAGWLLNHYLKIPTRILQRVGQFKARDWPKLSDGLRKIPWHQYFRAGDIHVKAATAQSRIRIKRGIEKVCLESIERASNHQPLRKGYLEVPQTVFVRLLNDLVTVSIDTSGEPLYKRGYKPNTVKAPVRETLAAALYFGACQVLGEAPAAVVDPMCGSGTLVFESLAFWQPNRSRQYAYRNFPMVGVLSFDLNRKLKEESPIGIGFDLDAEAIQASLGNREVFLKKMNVDVSFHRKEQPDLSIELWPKEKPTLVLINPPYNKRLMAESESAQALISKLSQSKKFDVIGILWPGHESPQIQGVDWTHFGFTTNGGIPVTLAFGKPLF